MSSFSTPSGGNKSKNEEPVIANHLDIYKSNDKLSPILPTQDISRRSVDVFNEKARSRLSSLHVQENDERSQTPSLYNLSSTFHRSGEQMFNRPSSEKRSFSIEPRRKSNDSFVSANNELQENFSGSKTQKEPEEGQISFDVGEWTVKSMDNSPSMPLKNGMSRSRLPSTANQSTSLDHQVETEEALYRINSEPIRGGRIVTAPFGTVVRQSNNQEGFDLMGMKETVYQVGIYLDQHAKKSVKASRSKDRQFWLAFLGIAITGFLSATDMTIISPILPTIAESLPPSEISATWITAGFLLTMMTFQPFWGGISDGFGRRTALLSSITIFLIGSIPVTAAQNMVTMVAGRAIQGIGGGGMLAIGEVLLSDMTTLAERGYFLGLLSMAFAVAAIAAPLIGGVFATNGGSLGWRWAFIINFPIGFICLALFYTSTKFRPPPKMSWRERYAHCDATSSLILFGSILSLLIGLTRGGQTYPWTDGGVIAPLVFGVIGFLIFLGLQWLPFPIVRSWYLAPRPVLDPAMFFGKGLRTSAIAFTLTFLHGILLYGAIQTLIIYFETRNATPLRAAINVLPANVPSTPAAFIAGILMAVTGRYKFLIIGSQILLTVGMGMLVYLNSNSPTYQWVIFQLIASMGVGAMYTLSLPPIQASLPPAYLARATATFAFVRSFGAIWGVSITLIAFSAQANDKLKIIPEAMEIGYNGSNAIAKTTSIRYISPLTLQSQIRNAFDESLRVSFALLVPIAAIGLILSLFIIHVPLPKSNHSEYVTHVEPVSNEEKAEEGSLSSLTPNSPVIPARKETFSTNNSSSQMSSLEHKSGTQATPQMTSASSPLRRSGTL